MSGAKRGETKGMSAGDVRRARQAEALRANLSKRKTQAKARKRAEPAADAEKKPDGNQS
jgi:hypothetical protein